MTKKSPARTWALSTVDGARVAAIHGNFARRLFGNLGIASFQGESFLIRHAVRSDMGP